MGIWSRIEAPEAGYLFSLSDALHIIENQHQSVLEPLNDGVMIVASDYSGQHKQATHEAYSFLVTTDKALEEWLPMLESFRAIWLPDGRRMSFKMLREPVRRRALEPFLMLSSMLSGNIITILIDRRVESFMAGGSAAILDVFADFFASGTKNGTIERVFRTASLFMMILFGLRAENQKSYWISDHDEALETYVRRENFARLSAFLSFGLTKWKNPADNWFETTGSPNAPDWAEDITAIPDLMAEAICRLSNILPSYFGTALWTTKVSKDQIIDDRARVLADWMALRYGKLRHVLLRLEQDEEGFARATAQTFQQK